MKLLEASGSFWRLLVPALTTSNAVGAPQVFGE